MTQVSEIAEPGHPSQDLPKQSRLGTISALLKMLRKNPGAIRKVRVMGPDEERYVRPPREYEIPPFHEGMQDLHLQRTVFEAHAVVQPP